MPPITPEEARRFSERWKLASEFELAELRRTSMENKLKQLSSLMASRGIFAVDSEREKGVLEVRRRWARLRGILGV